MVYEALHDSSLQTGHPKTPIFVAVQIFVFYRLNVIVMLLGLGIQFTLGLDHFVLTHPKIFGGIHNLYAWG